MFTSIDELLFTWKQESDTTRNVLAAMPQGSLSYRPHPKSRTAHELAWHLATAPRWFCVDMLKLPVRNATAEKWKDAPPTVEGMVEAYDNLCAAIGKALAKQGDAWLGKKTDFLGTPATNGLILGWMFLHENHHRGQLSVYLRPMGGKVPSIHGPSADSEQYSLEAPADPAPAKKKRKK